MFQDTNQGRFTELIKAGPLQGLRYTLTLVQIFVFVHEDVSMIQIQPCNKDKHWYATSSIERQDLETKRHINKHNLLTMIYYTEA